MEDESGNYIISTIEPVLPVQQTIPTSIGSFVPLASSKNTTIVIGSDALSSGGVIVGYMATMYTASLIGVEPSTVDVNVDVANLSDDDVLILFGGPLVNKLTKYYEELAPVKMIAVDTGIIVQTPQGNVTWHYPSVEGRKWYDVPYGYFVIQAVTDSSTGATIYMVYGTDADST